MAVGGVNSRALRTGRIPEADWSKISTAIGRLADAPLFIDDNPHLTVMDMRAKCRRLKAQHGDLGLVVVDYLQLMSTGKKAENRQVEVSELSRGLKVLARDLEIVAKHRNGPTAKIRLAFVEHLTKFADLAR